MYETIGSSSFEPPLVNGEQQQSTEASPETAKPANRNAVFARELISAEGQQSLRETLEDEIKSEPGLQHMQQIEHEYQRAKVELVDEIGLIIPGKEDQFYETTTNHSRRVELATELWGRQTVRRFEDINRELQALSDGRVEILGDQGRDLLEEMVVNSPEDPAHAARTFVSVDYLDAVRLNSVDVATIEFRGDLEPLDIPINYFISAEGFDSWYGRGKNGGDDMVGQLSGQKQTSLETIKEYADAETQPPPIEDMLGYVLPDGRVYFKSGNSHRLAAAIYRGDESVQFKGRVDIFYVDHVPSRLEQQQVS